jgi:hypothetical protein
MQAGAFQDVACDAAIVRTAMVLVSYAPRQLIGEDSTCLIMAEAGDCLARVSDRTCPDLRQLAVDICNPGEKCPSCCQLQ